MEKNIETKPLLEYKPDFSRAQRYWDALWNRDIIDRPCTLVTVPRHGDASKYSRIIAADDDFEDILAECDAYLESHLFLGEAMPCFRPGFGPDQMAGFVGAPLVINKGSSTTSWSEKIVTDWEEFLPLSIEDDNIYCRRMKEFHEAAEERITGRCLLCEIDLHSNIDLLEGLRGAQNLMFDMIDSPDIILEALSQAHDIYRQISEEFYRYGSKAVLGTTSALPMYDRGRYNRIQADYIALLSPDLFRRFVLPFIEAEAEYLDRSCFHLDGPDALKHLDDILAVPELDAVQWVSGAGSKPQIEWPDVLHRVQAAGKIIILHLSASDVKRIHGEYKPELVVDRKSTRLNSSHYS